MTALPLSSRRSRRITRILDRLLRDRSGLAMVEFALTLPFLVGVSMAGAELANYTTTKMRVSQLTLMIADNASRIGSGTMAAKTISEAQINDLLTGAGLQSGKINLFQNGRVILSSLQPTTTANKYVIKWQRCRGEKNVTSSYGLASTTEIDGIEVNGQTIIAPAKGAVMFVEINYTYRPLISENFLPMLDPDIRETAALTVRDSRDFTGGTNGIYNAENVTVSSCTLFTAT